MNHFESEYTRNLHGYAARPPKEVVASLDKVLETDDYTGDGVPLDDTTRSVVIIFHYVTFVAVAFALYAFLQKVDVFKQRIWSPFVLLVALTWLEIGPAFEIGNHFYENNWQLYESNSDLVNASFSFFNFGANNLLALSLRKTNLPLFRRGTGALDWLMVGLDFVFIALTLGQPFVYTYLGRETSVTFLSPVGAVAGIVTLGRLYQNLGPNRATLLGGVFFFVLAICGVIALAVYRSTGYEWVHIFIGGSFVSSVIPLSIAFLNAQLLPADEEGIQTIEVADNAEEDMEKGINAVIE